MTVLVSISSTTSRLGCRLHYILLTPIPMWSAFNLLRHLIKMLIPLSSRPISVRKRRRHSNARRQSEWGPETGMNGMRFRLETQGDPKLSDFSLKGRVSRFQVPSPVCGRVTQEILRAIAQIVLKTKLVSFRKLDSRQTLFAELSH